MAEKKEQATAKIEPSIIVFVFVPHVLCCDECGHH
jgi:hypothetical protein